MNSYEGQAVLLFDGRSLPVHARLTDEGPRKGWGGTLRIRPGQGMEKGLVFDAVHTEVEMPSGRVGLLLITQETEEGFEILGSGGPPF
jgi:hypothetical protein